MRTTLLDVLLTIVCVGVTYAAFMVTSSARGGPQAGQPPWASDKPVPAPEIFGEGVISTPDDEMDASFTADGSRVYFTKNHFGQRLGVIVESRLENRRWSTPQVVSFSGRYTDYDAFLTPDGSAIYFSSNRPLSGTAKKDFDIWFVEKTAQGWSEAKNAGSSINSSRDEFFPTVAADGTLYFSASRDDTKGGSDIYRARRRAGAYEAPENLGAAINSAAFEVDSWVSPDQTLLVFAAFGRPDDLGNGDLYVSRNVNGAWSPAKHLEAGINSSAREYCPGASPDGKYFFFTSFRGFGTTVPEKPWSYDDFQHGLRSVTNGWGNIYRIDMSALK